MYEFEKIEKEYKGEVKSYEKWIDLYAQRLSNDAIELLLKFSGQQFTMHEKWDFLELLWESKFRLISREDRCRQKIRIKESLYSNIISNKSMSNQDKMR